jgi:hypothetical protein
MVNLLIWVWVIAIGEPIALGLVSTAVTKIWKWAASGSSRAGRETPRLAPALATSLAHHPRIRGKASTACMMARHAELSLN